MEHRAPPAMQAFSSHRMPAASRSFALSHAAGARHPLPGHSRHTRPAADDSRIQSVLVRISGSWRRHNRPYQTQPDSSGRRSRRTWRRGTSPATAGRTDRVPRPPICAVRRAQPGCWIVVIMPQQARVGLDDVAPEEFHDAEDGRSLTDRQRERRVEAGASNSRSSSAG